MALTNRRRKMRRQKGAVTVEMALVLPVFVTLILGLSQGGQLLETQNLLASVAREGARLAAMDRSDFLVPGETTNQKIESDIKNFLTASGLSGEDADVFIVDPTDHVTPMDLDDEVNQLELFELRVELPYSSLNGPTVAPDFNLVSKIVFRNAPATFGQ